MYECIRIKSCAFIKLLKKKPNFVFCENDKNIN